MTPAQKEAYANARSTDIHLVTLELNHPLFDNPVRVVCDNDPLEAPLENTLMATFEPLQFSMKRPPLNEEPDPVISITLDNVTGLLNRYLEQAASSGQEATLTFRPYLYLAMEERAERVGDPLKMGVRNARADMQSVTLTAAYINPVNLPFPPRSYTPDEFPALV